MPTMADELRNDGKQFFDQISRVDEEIILTTPNTQPTATAGKGDSFHPLVGHPMKGCVENYSDNKTFVQSWATQLSRDAQAGVLPVNKFVETRLANLVTRETRKNTNWLKSTVSRNDLIVWAEKLNHHPLFLFPKQIQESSILPTPPTPTLPRQNKLVTIKRNEEWREQAQELLNNNPGRTIKSIAAQIAKEHNEKYGTNLSEATVEKEIRGIKPQK
ncbi:MAG: hypothetical protein H7832_14675 [Magnetococcus sp. DMHC-6]